MKRKVERATRLRPLTEQYYHLTMSSGNAKTGPIPVSTSHAGTCPDSCVFKGAGCYADSGPLKLHWNKVGSNPATKKGSYALSWDEFLDSIRDIPQGMLFRHNQAGDLPGENEHVDPQMLKELDDACRGLKAFTYTHKTGQENWGLYKTVKNLLINLSSNNLAHADELLASGLPVVTVVPEDFPDMGRTPGGAQVMVCPAQTGAKPNCLRCKLCSLPRGGAVIGFRAHGTGKSKITFDK